MRNSKRLQSLGVVVLLLVQIFSVGSLRDLRPVATAAAGNGQAKGKLHTASSPSVLVTNVSINYGNGLLVPLGTTVNVSVSVTVDFLADFNGVFNVRLVDADTFFDDLVLESGTSVNVTAGTERTFTFNAPITNNGGTLVSGVGSLGEKNVELGVEVGDSGANYYDSARKKYIIASAIKKEDLTVKKVVEFAVEVFSPLLETIDETSRAQMAIHSIDTLGTIRGLLDKQTSRELLQDYEQVLGQTDSAQVGVEMYLFTRHFLEAAGLGDVENELISRAIALSDVPIKIAANNEAGLNQDLRAAVQAAINADPDADHDGYDDQDELVAGSNPASASSTPELAIFPGSCSDGIDNDGDGLKDTAEADGPDNNTIADCLDSDADGIVDYIDNCQRTYNPGQGDADLDHYGDSCDAFPNSAGEFIDSDGDNTGDNADLDNDNDSWIDTTEISYGSDPRLATSTPEDISVSGSCTDQVDNDADAPGEPNGGTDIQDPGCQDSDADTISTARDNCPLTPNLDQTDTDLDGQGNACDTDDDNDNVPDGFDNCRLNPNPNQSDIDHDGIGDACDPYDNTGDVDADGVPDLTDNCPTVYNPDQTDSNGDGYGDACQPPLIRLPVPKRMV